MSKTLKPVDKKTYVVNGGRWCPYCGTDNIEATGTAQMDGPDGRQRVECLKCGRVWHDLLGLVGIEPWDED